MWKKLIVLMALAVLTSITLVSCEEDSTTEVPWYAIIIGTIADNEVDVTKNVEVEMEPNGLTKILTITGKGGTEDNKEWTVEFKLDADSTNILRSYSTNNPLDGVSIRYEDTDAAGIGHFYIDYTSAYNAGTAIITLVEYEEGSNILAQFEGDIFSTDGNYTILELEDGLIRADVFE